MYTIKSHHILSLGFLLLISNFDKKLLLMRSPYWLTSQASRQAGSDLAWKGILARSLALSLSLSDTRT